MLAAALLSTALVAAMMMMPPLTGFGCGGILSSIVTAAEAAPSSTICDTSSLTGSAPHYYNISDTFRGGFDAVNCDVHTTLVITLVPASGLTNVWEPYQFAVSGSHFRSDLVFYGVPLGVDASFGDYGPIELNVRTCSFAAGAGLVFSGGVSRGSVLNIIDNTFATQSAVYFGAISFANVYRVGNGSTIVIADNVVTDYSLSDSFAGPIHFNTSLSLRNDTTMTIDNNTLSISSPCDIRTCTCANGIYFEGLSLHGRAELVVSRNRVKGPYTRGLEIVYISFLYDEASQHVPNLYVVENSFVSTICGTSIYMNTQDGNLIGGGNLVIEGNRLQGTASATVNSVTLSAPLMLRFFQWVGATMPLCVIIQHNTLIATNTKAAFMFSVQITAPGSYLRFGFNEINFEGTTKPVVFGTQVLALSDLEFLVKGNRAYAPSSAVEPVFFAIDSIDPTIGETHFLTCNNSLVAGGVLTEVTPTQFARDLGAVNNLYPNTLYCYRCECTGSNPDSNDPDEWCVDQLYCCSLTFSYTAQARILTPHCPVPDYTYFTEYAVPES